MKKWKRWLSMALVLAMALSMAPVQAAETSGTPPSSSFVDMPQDWSRAALEKAVENGLMQGSNGQIDPKGLLTRAQMAAVVSQAFAAKEQASLAAFTDVDSGAWYYEPMQRAVAMGILSGDGASLSPDRPITRQETMAVLARAFGLTAGDASALERFSDRNAVADWAKAPVSAMAAGGYISGDEAGRLNPGATITRAEFAQIMDNMVKQYVPKSYSGTVSGSALIREADTVLDGSTIQGDLIIGDGVGSGDVTLKDTVIKGRLVVRGGGANSLHILGSTAMEEIIVLVPSHKVRLSNEGDQAPNVTVIGGKGEVILNGGFGSVAAETDHADIFISGAQVDSVVVSAPDAVVSLNGGSQAGKIVVADTAENAKIVVSGKADSVSTKADNTSVVVQSGGSVAKIETSGSDTAISGAGKVSEVEVQAGASGAKVTTPNTSITVDEGAGSVSTNKGTVAPGATGSSGSNSSGSSSSSSSQGTISLSGLEDKTLVEGGSAEITAAATASNGSAVTLTASSSDTAVASVTVDGIKLLVTAVGAGEAEITVTASAADCESVAQTFQVSVSAGVPDVELSREVFNFNSGWRFSKGQGYDNAESNRADKKEVVVIPNTETPYAVDYDVSGWEAVSLPHTYNDVDTFDNFTETGMNGERSVYGGTAWYKKSFTVPAEYEGKKIFLEFEAARQGAEVWLNGEKLEGKSESGFIPFGYDLTPFIRFGAENDITVMTDNSFPYYHIGEDGSKNELSWADSHWHPNNGGLYRNAFLYVTDPLHVTLPLYSFLETQGTYVYTQNETASSAEVVMEAEIANEYTEEKTFTYAIQILDAQGQEVQAAASEALTLAAGAKDNYQLKVTLTNPKRWSTEYPYLYQVVSKILVDGKEVDSTTTPLGVRTFRFTNDSGFFLNENYVKLQGWGQKPTDEWAGLGAAYPDWMHAYTQELMKDAGGNFIRWGHCAGSPSQIAISDQYGMVTLQPGVDGEGSTVGGTYSEYSYAVRKDAFRDMIIYYRNNPSIFLWEVGNQSMPDAEAKALTDLIYQYDSHGMSEPKVKRNVGTYETSSEASNRLVAVRRGNSVMANYVDVSVTTEGAWELKSDGKPGVEGEYNREEARRGVWDRYTTGFEDFKTPSGSSYNLTDEQFAVNQASNYSKISASAHSGGGNWIFSDSTSHGRVYSEVSRASGEVDAVRLPKEAYYTIKTIFSDTPDVHFVGHWNYAGDTGKTTFYATSNAHAVKLLVTGEDGTTAEYPGQKSNTYLFTFSDVAYTPGSAAAVAYDKEGNEVARHTVTTHGEAAALKITPIVGPQGLLANGSDILLLDVEAVDDQGNRCLTFDGTVNGKKTTFEINDADGTCIWRGGYNSGIEHSTNNKYLYLQGGVNRVAVRTTMNAGEITVTASTEGLASATYTTASKAVDNTGGLSSVLNEFKTLPLGTDPGVGNGDKPEVDDGTTTAQKSALLKESAYSGSDKPWKVTFPAIEGEQVYSDDKSIKFGFLPIELLNSEYLQIPQADANLTGATDVIQLRFARDVNLYIAHDDTIAPRPTWIASDGYKDTGKDITINGHSHSVFTKAFAADDSVTIFSNVAENMTKGGNQYVIFIKEQGQENTFLMDDFNAQTPGEAPAGWWVSEAENTSAKIVELDDGNRVLDLLDENTGSAPNMALVGRKFLPRYGRFSLEYKIYDFDLTVNNKVQDFVRIFLHKGTPSTDPNEHSGTVVESYLKKGSELKARQAGGGNEVSIKPLEKDKWFTVKYIVDMGEKSYDAYVYDESAQEFVLAKAGIKFRNDLDYVDYLLLGSGGGSGTHVQLDDIKIELIDDSLSEIQINGTALRDFDPDTTSYTHTLAVGTTEAPKVTAVSRDRYARVEITQPESVTGAATIKVTSLSGSVKTYTVTFTVATEINTTVEAINLNGTPLKSFEAGTDTYEIVLPPEADYPEVTVDKVDASDKVEIIGTDTVTITVNDTGTYTLKFTKATYELEDDFEAEELNSEVWTINHSVADGTNVASLAEGNEGKVLQLADNDGNMLFAHAKLANRYDTDTLTGQKLVMEWDLNVPSTQQWVRGLFSNGTDCLKEPTNNGKTDMAIEAYSNVAGPGKGDVMYKLGENSASTNQAILANDSVKQGEWNHMKLELLVDTGEVRVTVTHADGTTVVGTSKADIVRKNNGDKTTISYAQFGTGGKVTGTVQIDNVKVYVCSDID